MLLLTITSAAYCLYYYGMSSKFSKLQHSQSHWYEIYYHLKEFSVVDIVRVNLFSPATFKPAVKDLWNAA